MAHYETCPKCWGSGKLPSSAATYAIYYTCWFCAGRGWVSWRTM